MKRYKTRRVKGKRCKKKRETVKKTVKKGKSSNVQKFNRSKVLEFFLVVIVLRFLGLIVVCCGLGE